MFLVHEIFWGSMRRQLKYFLIVIDCLLIVLLLCPEISQIHVSVCEHSKSFFQYFLPLQQQLLCPLQVSGLETEGSEFCCLKGIENIFFVGYSLFKHSIGFFLPLGAEQLCEEGLAMSCFGIDLFLGQRWFSVAISLCCLRIFLHRLTLFYFSL